MATERELKYSVTKAFPDSMVLQAVFEANDYDLSQAVYKSYKDRYYDDALGTLKQAGYALRRRRSAKLNLATLKTRGAVDGAQHEREELELPLEGRYWPEEIKRQLMSLCPLENLRTQLELATERTEYKVKQTGKPIAVIAFDEVRANYPKSEQSVQFSETEIEAVDDTSLETLEAIAELIDRFVPLSPNSSSKPERARALLSLGEGF